MLIRSGPSGSDRALSTPFTAHGCTIDGRDDLEAEFLEPASDLAGFVQHTVKRELVPVGPLAHAPAGPGLETEQDQSARGEHTRSG